MQIDVDVAILVKWIGSFMAVVGFGAWLRSAVVSALKPVREFNEKLDSHNGAVCTVLKNSIVRTHRDFTSVGKIGRYSLQSALDMYEQYKKLGGNGFIDDIIADLRSLPIDTGATSNRDSAADY